MGGNARNAAKGPDRRTSTCGDCGNTFEHGKFQHPDFCEECRADRRDPADLITYLDVEADTDTNTVTLTVTIENLNDVPYRNINLERDGDTGVNIIGYVRIEGGEFEAETAWAGDYSYDELNFRAEHEKKRVFTWDDGEFEQDAIRTKSRRETDADEFHELVTMTIGDPFDADELTAEFIPASTTDEIDAAETTVSVPNFLIDI